jgi:hypothetical protein
MVDRSASLAAHEFSHLVYPFDLPSTNIALSYILDQLCMTRQSQDMPRTGIIALKGYIRPKVN